MYKRQNYKKILEDITVSRETAEREADARSEALCAANDELRAIDTELKSTGMKLFKLACLGQDITPLKERNQFLCAERKRIIVSLGYPEDYTEPKYSCAICSDTGFTHEGTKYCSCLRERLVRENIKSSGIGNLIEKQSFDNFRLDVYESNPEHYKMMKAILQRAKQYADTYPNCPTTLLLLGKTGTGKTHISTSIAGSLKTSLTHTKTTVSRAVTVRMSPKQQSISNATSS